MTMGTPGVAERMGDGAGSEWMHLNVSVKLMWVVAARRCIFFSFFILFLCLSKTKTMAMIWRLQQGWASGKEVGGQLLLVPFSENNNNCSYNNNNQHLAITIKIDVNSSQNAAK